MSDNSRHGTTTIKSEHPHDRANDFAQNVEGRARGFFAESLYFLRQNRSWWLSPVIVALLLIGLLVVLAGTGAAPFIYTLF